MDKTDLIHEKHRIGERDVLINDEIFGRTCTFFVNGGHYTYFVVTNNNYNELLQNHQRN